MRIPLPLLLCVALVWPAGSRASPSGDDPPVHGEAPASDTQGRRLPPPIRFADVTWQAHAGRGGDVHYVPAGQSHAVRVQELVTLHATPEDALDAGLEGYTGRLEAIHRRRGGDVLSSECVPATAAHAADCTLMVVFTGTEHVELAVAKHVATRRGLLAASYAHREYGPAAGQQARAWIASPEGQRLVAGFIDWVGDLGMAMDAP